MVFIDGPLERLGISRPIVPDSPMGAILNLMRRLR